MQDLLKVDYGVLALTICNFLLLVFLLKKFAWGPIIGALEKREAQVRADKETARSARENAEQLQQELSARLSKIADEASQKMAQAVALGQAQKEEILAQTKEQCARMLAQAQAQIEAEKEQALAQVRGEISRLSVLAASRLIGEEMNASHADKVVQDVLAQVKQK